MAAITLKTARKHLDMWLEAEMKVTNAQSYKIGTRSLTYADIGEIRKSIEYWSDKVEQLENIEASGGRNRARRFVPRDL